jgi:membrane fusion protein, macrolide-specific efflux system
MSWIKNHKKLFVILCLALIICIVFISNKKTVKEPSTVSLKKGSLIECVYGIGTVTANKSYQLKTGIAGKIKNIFVKEGDSVQKGDKLAEIETIFTAPFSGIITMLSYQTGETVFPQSKILQLIDPADRHISVVLDQTGVLRVKKDQKIKISFDGVRDMTFEGKVSSIYPRENNFIVRIDIPNLPSYILPGMTADIAIEIAERKNILLIPVNAIEKNKIYIKTEKGKPKEVNVKIGLNDGVMAEIISSELKEGDILLVQNKEFLREKTNL